MTTLTPTPEQAAILDAASTGDSVVIISAAGAGKTSTQRLAAEQAGPRRRVLYAAYNRDIADDAAGTFPANTLCSTVHSLAYRATGAQFRHRMGDNAPHVSASESARILRINEAITVSSDLRLQPNQIQRLARMAVVNYCKDGDYELKPWHVPAVEGITSKDEVTALRDAVFPYARRAWLDMSDPGGHLKFDQAVYLKLWALSEPVLRYDTILFDEAQDANKVILRVIRGQQDHAQLIVTGDPNQAINGWNGATNALDLFDAPHRLTLTTSFRFGPVIATEANRWLTHLDAEFQVKGYGQVPSRLCAVADPDAVLCRTNAKAIEHVMALQDSGKRVALAGKNAASGLVRLAEAAIDLKEGKGCSHPALFAFRTWGEVQDHADDPAAGDLRLFVTMIDKHGPDKIIAGLGKLTSQDRADVTVSTVHKAKGREWKRVRIAGDFRAPKDNDDGSPGDITREQAMLIYVALTRACLDLDHAALDWADDYLAAPAQPRELAGAAA